MRQPTVETAATSPATASASAICPICEETVARGQRAHVVCDGCAFVYHKRCVLGVGYCVNARCVRAHPALGRGGDGLPPVLRPFARAVAAVASLELPVSAATLRVALGLSLVATIVVVASVFLVDSA